MGGYLGRGPAKYRPSESGYSRDADKIEATMATWKDFVLPEGAYAYAEG